MESRKKILTVRGSRVIEREISVRCGGGEPTSGLQNLGNRLYAFAHERFRNEEVGLFWMKKNEREEGVGGEGEHTQHGWREAERKRKEESEGRRKREWTHREVEVDDLSLDFCSPFTEWRRTSRDATIAVTAAVPRSAYLRPGFHLDRYTLHADYFSFLLARLPDDYTAYRAIQHGDTFQGTSANGSIRRLDRRTSAGTLKLSHRSEWKFFECIS